MSRIGEITDDVVRRGREKRETWSPKVGGVPLRRYQWWCKETGNYRSQENFCHYWRVALIWAPLLRLRRSLTPRKLRGLDADDVMLVVMLLMCAAGLVALAAYLAASLWSAIGAWAIVAAPAIIVGFIAAAVGTLAGIGVSCERTAKYVKGRRCRKRLNAPVPVTSVSRETRPPKQRRAWPAVMRGLLWIGRPIGRVLAAVWEYVVLVAQVVRVKKWKICPIVEIPASASS